jgi:hypothetical protein
MELKGRESQFLDYKPIVKRETERHEKWPHKLREQQANVPSA